MPGIPPPPPRWLPEPEERRLYSGLPVRTYQMRPSDRERALIELRGTEYFWAEDDNWRNPKMRYRMPEFDWSEVALPEDLAVWNGSVLNP